MRTPSLAIFVKILLNIDGGEEVSDPRVGDEIRHKGRPAHVIQEAGKPHGCVRIQYDDESGEETEEVHLAEISSADNLPYD